MNLDPLYLQVLPRLANTGSAEQARGVLTLASIDVGHRHFDVPQGIVYDADLVNTSEAILLSGTASAVLHTKCDRCLEDTQLSITGEIQGYYLFDTTHAPGEEKLEAYEVVDPSGRIDIAPPVLASIVFELPTVTLCREDCEGVSAQPSPSSAGEESAEVSGEGADGYNPESPFAALKDLM
ncbi:MAG: DUF177 domain-containing protein [Coriobacteriales bacterium]|jgi:uncharacterized protein|nr:DUF177 domain-containing protein [Coriobacteriales bacterium]